MFDTLKYAKKLEASGMTRDQAEAQIQVIAEMVVDGVATKQDIALHKAEMAKEFVEVRSEMAQGFAEVRSEMAQGLAEVRSELHKEINRTLKITGAMIVTSTTFTIGVLGLLLK